MTIEKWLPVVGFEGLYEVSDLGRVKSLDRTVKRGVGGTKLVRGRVLKTTVKADKGTAIVALYGDESTRGGLQCRVGRIVLEAFVGPCPPGMQCCHWDDVKTNNRLSNLRWDTCAANKHDAVRNGRHTNANKTHCPKNHEYNEANTRINTQGSRYCVACHRARYVPRRHRQAA